MIRIRTARQKVQEAAREAEKQNLIDRVVITAEEAVVVLQCFVRVTLSTRRVQKKRSKKKAVYLQRLQRRRGDSIYATADTEAEVVETTTEESTKKKKKNEKERIVKKKKDVIKRISASAMEAAAVADQFDSDDDFDEDYDEESYQ